MKKGRFTENHIVSVHKKHEAEEYLVGEEQLSNQRAYKKIDISRTICQYQSKRKDDTALQEALTHLTIQQPLNIPSQPNLAWSVDFMSDSLPDERKFRLFNVIDDFSHES
jgi:hypothetical protein